MITFNDIKEYIFSLYKNILNREPDSFGFEYWQNQLQSNKENKNDLLIGFADLLSQPRTNKYFQKKHP